MFKDTKVSIERLYENGYVANIEHLNHSYITKDTETDLVNKLGLYNRYNYGLSELTNLYSKPSVAIYDKPFLKYIPRYYKESRQSYNVYDADVNLKTLEGYEFIKPVVDYSITLSSELIRYDREFDLSSTDIRVQETANKPFSYDNNLEKYYSSFPSVTIDSPVLYSKNYLTYSSSSIETSADLSTFRYDNGIKSVPSYDIIVPNVKVDNYLVKNEVADLVITPSYNELRYDNNLSKYTPTYDVVIDTSITPSYLKTAKTFVEPVSTVELRYDNNLSKYTPTYDVVLDEKRNDNYFVKYESQLLTSDLSVFRYDNNLSGYSVRYESKTVSTFKPERNYPVSDLITKSDLSLFKYDRDLSNYTWSIEVKHDFVRYDNYLGNVGVVLDESTVTEFRYNNTIEKFSNTSYELKTSNELEKPLYDNQVDIYKVYNRTDLSTFGYRNDVAKYGVNDKPDIVQKPTFRYENTNISTFKRNVDVTLTSQQVERPLSYSRVSDNKSFEYKVANAPELKMSGAFNKIKSITKVNYHIMPNKADVNNLYDKQEILQGIAQHSYKYATNDVKGAIYKQSEKISDRVPTYNRMIETIPNAQVYDKKVSKEELTPLYKGEFKYTDTETRFTLRGPVNYNMYGDEVKVVMMEQNKQGFAWEQQMDSVGYKTKNLLQQESAFTYKKDPIVVSGSPVLTRENQIEYYFGGQGKLKMEKISATYDSPDDTYPLAAPLNATLKGIMRPTTSVAIQHIIEYDYDKIDEVDVIPVFNETGDRVSLFSDRFFLQ